LWLSANGLKSMTGQPAELLHSIAENAKFISERLNEAAAASTFIQIDDAAEGRLSAWAAAVSPELDWQAFDRRLAWQGCDTTQAKRSLSNHLPDGTPALPAWIVTFQRVLDSIGKPVPLEVCRPASPVPFEDVLLPFVSVFFDRLSQRDPVRTRLSEPALVRLGQVLLEQLSRQASQTLFLEFDLYRTQAQCSIEQFLAGANAASDSYLYQGFVAEIDRDPLRLWVRYPVLARVLCAITDLWCEAQCELVDRLVHDLPFIERAFARSVPLGRVQVLRPMLGDCHSGHRTVTEVEFENGLRLINKPRPIDLEAAWNSLLRWLNERQLPLKLRALTVVDREEYGWVESAQADECQDMEAVARFYRRSGMLLCLMHILGGTDVHYENMMACGEHPVIVDNETVMSPSWRTAKADSPPTASETAWRQFNRSILATGMVPHWQLSEDQKKSWDISALGGFGEQEPDRNYPQWCCTNTDKMELRFEPGAMRLLPNLPRLRQQRLDITGYADEVAAGFRDMYDFLCRERDALLAGGGPLAQFRGATGRVLYRGTRIYGLLLLELQLPKYQHHGADFSIVLEMLAQAFVDAGEKPVEWPVFLAEVKALEQLDTPLFRCRTDGHDLILENGERVPDMFPVSGFDEAVAHLEAMNSADREMQLGILHDSMTCRFGDMPEATRISYSSPDTATVHTATGDLLAAAAELAKQLKPRAIVAGEGAAWIGPQSCPEVGRIALRPLDARLYDGAPGVALFLGALATATGSCEYKQLAIQAMTSTCADFLAQLRGLPDGPANIGAAAGAGGLVYALVRLFHWLAEPALLANAETIAASIKPERIAADQQLDLIGGAAGAALALHALHCARPAPSLLERAYACGIRLVQKSERNAAGERTWPALMARSARGLAHGAAGIACALMRLGRIPAMPDSETFLSCAQEALLRIRTEELQLTSGSANDNGRARWCTGAPGLGLFLLEALSCSGADAALLPEIETLIDRTMRALEDSPADLADHLCCGRMGQIDFLLTSGEVLGRAELVEQAKAHAALITAEAHRKGGFRSWLRPPGTGVPFCPGLFTGTAGIGYSLVRLAHPGRFPSVLLWL
jgi:type 2 lantibiotic biosynthesis protein LanM